MDHGSKIFKFYVIGDKVFYAVRDSMPNAHFLKSSSGGEALTFNRYSLKTTCTGKSSGLLYYHSIVKAWYYNTELCLNLACVSLKTLPVATKEQQRQTRVQDSKLLDANLVEEAAKFLNGLLGLTIFGFDVVVSIFCDSTYFIFYGLV